VKIALATTTIHVPHALKLMRKCSTEQCSTDVRFFIAKDKKTPAEAGEFLSEIDHVHDVLEGTQAWKCSELIGWNTLARRNIAFLEALKWGADAVYSWDNDNLPVDLAHFYSIEQMLDPWHPWHGIRMTSTSPNPWFDPGSLLIPKTRHRGFPHDMPSRSVAEPVTDAKIGIAAGLIIGNPDIDAVTRMELKPDIGAVHILGSTGVVVDPNTWTIWNSQNTAVVRELVPSWFMAPGCGRHDDIYASLVVQRVMRERGYHVHFGKPFCFQERNPHDLLVDLRAEIDGMSNVLKLATLLDSIQLFGRNVVDDTRHIYETLKSTDWYPPQAIVAALAYLEDCESVL